MKSPTLRLGALPPIQVSPGTLVTVAVFALMLYPSFSDGSGTFSAAAAAACSRHRAVPRALRAHP